MSIYLDYNASAPIDSEVLKTMIDVYQNHIGNPNSRTHDFGDDTRKIVENSRKQVAELLNVQSNEVFFTSGATESNNIAIQGLMEYAKRTGKKHIITSSIEHKSVLETIKALSNKGFDIDIVDPDISGRVNEQEIIDKVNDHTLLISIMHVNNETGMIQPVKEIGEALEGKGVFFHIDVTQSMGKLINEIRDLKYDMLSFSAHKLSGPQGVGGLILRRHNYKLPPVRNILYGGEQEHGIRPGTLPVALIAGLGKACELSLDNFEVRSECVRKIKSIVLDILIKSGISFSINGNQDYCVDNTLNLCIKGVSSEALMLSSKQYCGVSNGSACTSQSYQPSYVLTAMGVPEADVQDSVRISWGADTNIEQLTNNLKEFFNVAKSLQG